MGRHLKRPDKCAFAGRIPPDDGYGIGKELASFLTFSHV